MDGKDLQLRFAKAMVLLQAQRPAEALPLAEALAEALTLTRQAVPGTEEFGREFDL